MMVKIILHLLLLLLLLTEHPRRGGQGKMLNILFIGILKKRIDKKTKGMTNH
jgi:hypothetical protein